MEFSIATLLANFTDDKLVAPKVLEKKLGCNDKADLNKLQIVLDALEKVGILVKDRGRYRRTLEEELVEAKLRCSSKGFCFAIQDAEGSEDIYVRECHLSTAWNGDRVLVRVTKEGSRRRSPEGEVKLILERANPSVLARVRRDGDEYRAQPLDDRLLFELNLAANGIDLSNSIDHLVHVEIVRYPLGNAPPRGRVARILGSDAEAAADIDIVCCKHDLPRTFPEAVTSALKGLPKQVRKTDLKNRVDLRKLQTVAISGDSEEAAEHECWETALTVESVDGNLWRLGVHTTDVARYVVQDSVLDRVARKRSTALYLHDQILPLLPEALAVQRCSLMPEQERLAISTFLTIDETGQVVEFELQPSVVQVDARFSYLQAQAILERDAETKTTDEAFQQAVQQHAPYFEIIDRLLTLSQALRQQREKRGGFALNLPEAKFNFSDEGSSDCLVTSAISPAQGIILEVALVVNQAISMHLQALGVPGIYRVQPTPELDDVQETIKLAANLEMEIALEEPETVLPKDYQQFTQQFSESSVEKVLTYLLQATLKPAAYSSTPGPHFSLALEGGYTQAIAPARRYADLLIQRVLHAVFEQGRDRRSSRAKDSVNLRHSSCHGQINWNVLPPEIQHELEASFASAIFSLNDREKLAQDAEADLDGLKKAELMKKRTGNIFQGLITGVQSYGFFVEIEELLVEGLVHVSSLKDDWYEYRSRQQTLVGRKNRKQYRLGDSVEVQVKSVDYYRQQIDLVTVGGGSEAPDSDEDTDTDSNDTRGSEEE